MDSVAKVTMMGLFSKAACEADLLGDILLSDITPELIREHLKPKKSKTPATYNRHRAVLSSLLKFAIEQNDASEGSNVYISKNPCNDVRSLPENNKRVRYLTDDEKPKFLKSAKAISIISMGTVLVMK